MLEVRYKELMVSKSDVLEQIYWLLEDGKRYGTLPFAGLARAGFVGIQILRSMVSIGIFSEQDYHSFIGSISTISQEMARDRLDLKKEEFLKKYGHLRPGSYDVLSPRYDEAPDLYFDWNTPVETPSHTELFNLSKGQVKEINSVLQQNGIISTPEDLISFIKRSVELRELSKFHFTRNLSDVLSLITRLGDEYGFSNEEMAYCNINTIKEMHISGVEPLPLLRQAVENGRADYEETLKISLPPVITKPADVWSFEWPQAIPNFITQKQITAPVSDANPNKNLSGKIVCIPNADPGFDWLFSHRLAGLITAWGGPNSHMAIRAGELGLPALIGTGELLYHQLSTAEVVYIDCVGKRTEIIS